jgi:hypothetical protein
MLREQKRRKREHQDSREGTSAVVDVESPARPPIKETAASHDVNPPRSTRLVVLRWSSSSTASRAQRERLTSPLEATRSTHKSAFRGGVGPYGLLLILLIGFLALNVTWLIRFRLGYATGWDESGYMAIGLRDTHAFLSGGPVALFREFEGQSLEGPLVPLLTVPVTALLGAGVFQSLLVMPLFAAGLVLATFALARQVGSAEWALVAALAVAGMPAVADYSRLYHFAVPAAAFLTASIWALLRSKHLEQRRWVILGGLFAGLMLLTRTMTVAYLPALILIATAQLLAVQRNRRERVISVIFASFVTFLVAGSWYARNWKTVFDYLLGSGYGEASSQQGPASAVTSWAYWSKELRIVLDQLYLPLAAALAICLLLGLGALLSCLIQRSPTNETRSGPRLSLLGSGVFSLVVIVLEGYLVLTSSKNAGTAFALPWLPSLVVLATVAAARTPIRAMRIGLAVAVAGVSLGNLVMKSGWIESIATPRGVWVPSLGQLAISDGRGPNQIDVLGAGYPVSRVTSPLAPLHRRWLPFTREVTGWMIQYAGRRGQPVRVLVGSNDLFFNQNQITLVDAIWFHRNVSALWIGDALLASANAGRYREKVGEWDANFIATTQAGRTGVGADPARLNHLKVEAAALALGFRLVKTFSLPDGRLVWLSWRSRGSLRCCHHRLSSLRSSR